MSVWVPGIELWRVTRLDSGAFITLTVALALTTVVANAGHDFWILLPQFSSWSAEIKGVYHHAQNILVLHV